MAGKDLVKTQDTGIVMPAVNAKEALAAWQAYLDLKEAIVDKKTDVQFIDGKPFLKKSYWRKTATFFNLNVEVVEEHSEKLGSTFVYHFSCKATAPNGRYAIGVGSCDAFEKAKMIDGKYMAYNKYKKIWEPAQPNSLHNIRSTAETRAFNRAVSNLVGGGEVSAEEINDFNKDEHIGKDVDQPSESLPETKPKPTAKPKVDGITPAEAKYDVSKEADESGLVCETFDCGTPITKAVADYSKNKFRHALCMSCQKLAVGTNSDELVEHGKPTIPQLDPNDETELPMYEETIH